MSLGQFNLTPYNYKPLEIQDNEASYRIYATLTATVAIDVELVVDYRCNGTLEGEANLQYFYNEPYRMEQSIDGKANAAGRLVWIKKLEADLTGNASLAIPAVYRMDATTDVSVNMRFAIILDAKFLCLLSSKIDSLITSDEEMWFEDVTLKPNETIVIDSGVFTILHNTQNIIDKYEGEWPTFDKRLDGVVVESLSGGNAQVSILYRERYL